MVLDWQLYQIVVIYTCTLYKGVTGVKRSVPIPISKPNCYYPNSNLYPNPYPNLYPNPNPNSNPNANPDPNPDP